MSLGLCGIRRRNFRRLRLRNAGERLHVEFLVVPVACHNAGFDALYQQEPHADVCFPVRWEPHLVIHKRLLKDKACSFLQIREQAAANLYIADEIGLQPGYLVRFFVYPHDPGKSLHDFFHQLARFEIRIRLEIEYQHVQPAESLAAWVHKLARAQEDFDPRLVLVFLLPLLPGFFFLRFFLGFALLQLLDAFAGLLVFFFLLLGAQPLAVFFHERRHFVPVEIEEGVFASLALLHPAVAFKFGLFLGLRACVVLPDLVCDFLVLIDFLEERLKVRQLHLRLFREVEDAFAHGSVDRRTCHADIVFFAVPVQFNLVRKFHPLDRAVIVVQNLFLDSAYRRGFLHDQVRLRIEVHLPLHARRGGQFQLQSVLPPHLRVIHENYRHFAFLGIYQMRIVILRGGFQLHPFGSDQRAEFSARDLMPRGLPVVGFDQILFINQEFHVVAIGQLRIERVGSGFASAVCECSFQRERLDLAQNSRSTGGLDVLTDYLTGILRGRGTNRAGQGQRHEHDRKRRAHGAREYERNPAQKVSHKNCENPGFAGGQNRVIRSAMPPWDPRAWRAARGKRMRRPPRWSAEWPHRKT